METLQRIACAALWLSIETMGPKELEFPQGSTGGRTERPYRAPITGAGGACLRGRDFTVLIISQPILQAMMGQ